MVAGLVLAGLVAAGGWGWRRWRERQQAPIVRAAIPPLPDLSAWPEAYAARVRAATAAAARLEQPRAALGELACLYHANGCYREAQQVELGLHALEPKNARWAYYLADCCQNLGDMDGTRRYLETTLRLAPYYPVTRLKLAELLLKLGLPDEAGRQYQWRLTLVPNDPYALLGLARIALTAGNRAEALRDLEIITRTSPSFSPAHNMLYEIYGQMGDPARAAQHRQLGSAAGRFIEANDPMLYRVYAWSFDPFRLEVQGGGRLQARELEASLPFYEQAVRLAPQDGPARAALAQVYLQLNRRDDAVAAWREAARLDPQSAGICRDLGQALLAAGRAAEARQAFQRGLELARQAHDPAAIARFEELLAGPPK